MTKQDLPLAGVRVLDLSRLLPGAYCSLLLADLGAVIVKVEDMKGGDYLRWIPPLVNSYGVYYHAMNRNKRSIALDLAATKGKSVFKRLVADFDVVLESFRPGVMDRLGLGYSVLQTLNPRLVYCAISGYGQDGPYRLRAGHDINYISIAGILGATGAPDGAPVIPAAQIGDFSGSYAAAVGILAALVGCSVSGRGRMLDISLTESALSFMATHLAKNSFDGGQFQRGRGMLSGGLACYNIYRTKDQKYLALGALEPKFWSAFAIAIGREDWVGRQFDDDQEALSREVARVVSDRTRDEWLAIAQAHEICCEPVYDLQEVAYDSQLAAREVLVHVEHAQGASTLQVRTPIRLSDAPAAPLRPAPDYGADTRSILTEHGFSDAEIQELFSEKVIGGPS